MPRRHRRRRRPQPKMSPPTSSGPTRRTFGKGLGWVLAGVGFLDDALSLSDRFFPASPAPPARTLLAGSTTIRLTATGTLTATGNLTAVPLITQTLVLDASGYQHRGSQTAAETPLNRNEKRG